MAFEPSTNFKKGQEFESSYGRKYSVLAGPFPDNTAVWYVVLDETDGLVRLMSERRLQGMTGRSHP